MAEYDKILVPTDGSEGAEVALDHAIEIAEKFDAEVHTVYIVDLKTASTQEPMPAILEQLREVGDNAVEAIAERLEETGLDYVEDIKEGIPHQEINAYAEENDIDLIVMGTHGRTGLDRILLGSTTEKVLRTSKAPVMTVNRDAA